MIQLDTARALYPGSDVVVGLANGKWGSDDGRCKRRSEVDSERRLGFLALLGCEVGSHRDDLLGNHQCGSEY